MKIDTIWNPSETCLTIQISSRDDLDRIIDWLPSMRAIFTYPEPPADPKPGDFEDMGSKAPKTEASHGEG